MKTLSDYKNMSIDEFLALDRKTREEIEWSITLSTSKWRMAIARRFIAESCMEDIESEIYSLEDGVEEIFCKVTRSDVFENIMKIIRGD